MTLRRQELYKGIGLDVTAAAGSVVITLPKGVKSLGLYAVARTINGGAGPATTFTLRKVPFTGLADKVASTLVLNNVNTIGTLLNKDVVPELAGEFFPDRVSLDWVTSGGPTSMLLDVILLGMVDV